MAQEETATVTAVDAATPLPNSQGTGFPFRTVAAKTGRAVLVGVLSGGVAGLLAGGIGSRVAMRIIAAVGGPSIQGLETEFGALVGDITAGGTFFLIFAGAVLGGFGGLIYVAARSWLPGPVWLRAPLHGVFMMFVAAVFLLDKDNPDFPEFGHAVLSVTLFALIPFLYGVIQVPVAGWLDRKLPTARPFGTPPMVYTLGSLIVLFPVLPIIGGALSEQDGPLVLLAFLPLVLVYALLFLRSNGAILGRRYAGPVPVVVRFGGYAVLGVAAGFGAYQFVDSVNYFLS